MTFFFAFLIPIFVFALLTGLVLFKSSIWKYVDVIYYPLAAIGIALLFANASGQRQLINLSQIEENHKSRLAALTERKPQIQIAATKELVDSSFRLVGTISEYAEVCKNVTELQPRCSVALKLKQPVDAFLLKDRSLSGQPLELRLSAACSAADKMLVDIERENRMSSMIGGDLIVQYKKAIQKGLPSYVFEPLAQEISTFEEIATSKVENLRTILKDKSEAAKFVMNMHFYEIEFGTVLFQGLMPCVTTPRNELDVLINWTSTHQSEEEQLAQLEVEKQKLKNAGPPFPKLALLHLWVWPYILVIALALKFAKGVAEIKKHRVTIGTSPTDDSSEGL